MENALGGTPGPKQTVRPGGGRPERKIRGRPETGGTLPPAVWGSQAKLYPCRPPVSELPGLSRRGIPTRRWGKVYLLQCFFTRLRLKKSLTQAVRFRPRNARYSIEEMVLALLDPLLLGLEGLASTHLLACNGVFRYLTGLPVYPNASTLWQVLLLLGQQGLARLRRFHDHLPPRAVASEGRWRFIFGVDPTVILVYRHQEQARRGYNPTEHLFANEAYFHLLLCAYNLVQRFKRFCLPEGWHAKTWGVFARISSSRLRSSFERRMFRLCGSSRQVRMRKSGDLPREDYPTEVVKSIFTRRQGEENRHERKI